MVQRQEIENESRAIQPVSQEQFLQQQQQDPFARMGGNLPPNLPIQQEGSAMIDALLSNENVNEQLQSKFFWVFGRDNSLTFLDDDRKISKLMRFDILKIDALNAMPYYQFGFGDEFEWSVMRNIFETKLDRSRGIDSANNKNERTTQQSQFSESRNIQESGQLIQAQKEGFLKRLIGRR